jgi:hypothetical protein
MPRTLVTIPHFYAPQRVAKYGSNQLNPRPRIDSLQATIVALRMHFAERQEMARNENTYNQRANDSYRMDVDVVVCTRGTDHLLAYLGLPDGFFRHEATECEPTLLGFECHKVLQRNLDDYDYFCFMEDDLVIHDPLFFQKLIWFSQSVGPHAVLQPNRYEVSLYHPLRKLYIDSEYAPSPQHRKPERGRINASVLGRDIAFIEALNPHVGFFFLSRAQMEAWIRSPSFLDGDISYVGPLESAATLGLIKNFRVFRTALDTAAFLEIEHFGSRFISLQCTSPS